MKFLSYFIYVSWLFLCLSLPAMNTDKVNSEYSLDAEQSEDTLSVKSKRRQKKTRKNNKACDHCRKNHLKCSTLKPCKNCSKKNIDCTGYEVSSQFHLLSMDSDCFTKSSSSPKRQKKTKNILATGHADATPYTQAEYVGQHLYPSAVVCPACQHHFCVGFDPYANNQSAPTQYFINQDSADHPSPKDLGNYEQHNQGFTMQYTMSVEVSASAQNFYSPNLNPLCNMQGSAPSSLPPTTPYYPDQDNDNFFQQNYAPPTSLPPGFYW